MSIVDTKNNNIVENDILLSKWKTQSVYENGIAKKPSMCIFNNITYALDLLHKHIVLNSKIAMHTDVDVDGIGTTYILKKTLQNLGSNNHILLINKDKVHGIQQKHAEYFSKNSVDLMIITDSSSNEIDIIKQFNCDVLVVDHHDMLHDDLLGYCNDGVHRYVIVNNNVENKNQNQDILWLSNHNIEAFKNIEEYKATNDMSCGLLIYELLRVYCECFSNPKLLDNLMLYQWVGVTLFTDVIDTLNERNQWYLDNTVFSRDIESSLGTMMHKITQFKATLDASYIGYSFAPLINKAIRAGQSAEALDIVINRPDDILQLKKYEKAQADAIDKVLYITENNGSKSTRVFNGDCLEINLDEYGVHRNYSGVIAGRLSGQENKNVAAYVVLDNGRCKGSFRGRYKNVNYRKYFETYSPDIYAQGHPPAFGFELTKAQLDDIMQNLHTIEPIDGEKTLFSFGNIQDKSISQYYIDDINEFKRQGYIWKIATGNAKVSSSDKVNIKVSAKDVVLKSTQGKLYLYDVLGLNCKAFKALSGNYFDVYIEYTTEINIYIR